MTPTTLMGSVVIGFSGMYLTEDFCWTSDVAKAALFLERADWFSTAREFEGVPAILDFTERRRNIQLFDLSGREELTVSRDQRFGASTFDAATVNWKACGSVSVERATEYARLLTLGAKLAERL